MITRTTKALPMPTRSVERALWEPAPQHRDTELVVVERHPKINHRLAHGLAAFDFEDHTHPIAAGVPTRKGIRMNPIEKMEAEIGGELGRLVEAGTALSASTKLTRPHCACCGCGVCGVWWLDLRLDDEVVVVEWMGDRGFAVSKTTKDTGFGEGPDEVFDSREPATTRALELLKSPQPQPPAP